MTDITPKPDIGAALGRLAVYRAQQRGDLITPKPDPLRAEPLTEAGLDELRRMRREGTTWGAAYSGELIDALLATIDRAAQAPTSPPTTTFAGAAPRRPSGR